MMRKTIIQGLFSIIIFFSTWFGLTQINWVSIFRVQKVKDKTEEKLGDIFWKIFQKNDQEIKDPYIVNSVDSLITKICTANSVDKKILKVHIVSKDEINAFALPNAHLIVYSGLILSTENAEELSGVICHELAHIQLNHVMKKLVKEIGLTALISMTSGNGGSEVIRAAIKRLSSSAFDRNFEKEADIMAVDYMQKAKIDPKPFASFLYRLSYEEDRGTKYMSWVSTHPESKERAEYISAYAKGYGEIYEPVLKKETWERLKEKLEK